MEKEIKAIIKEEFKKLLNRTEKRKEGLEKRLMGNHIEEERLEAAYDKIMWDKIVKEHLIKELNKRCLMKQNYLKKQKKNYLE